MLLTIFKFFAALYIFLLVAATITWNYRPTMYVNLNYDILTENNITSLETNALYISQHINRLVIFEQMIMCQEVKKSKFRFNIVEEESPDWYNEFFKHLPKFTSYNLITVKRDKKNNKSSVIKDILKKDKENVLIFLANNKKTKSIYHILKETKKPLVLVNMIETKNKFKWFNTTFRLDYRVFKDYPIDKNSEDFVKWLENELYSYYEVLDNKVI